LAWLWSGVGRKARYGTMHRCRHAVVSCMEAVAFLLHVRCTEHVACYLLHAACMMRLARKANGSPWCAQGTNRTEFPCGFSSTAAVCRTCRTLALMVLHLPVIRAAAPPGILTPPLPTAAPGTGPRPLQLLPRTGPPVPFPGPHPDILPRGLGPDPSPLLPGTGPLAATSLHLHGDRAPTPSRPVTFRNAG
jgi:hypothetical protein